MYCKKCVGWERNDTGETVEAKGRERETTKNQRELDVNVTNVHMIAWEQRLILYIPMMLWQTGSIHATQPSPLDHVCDSFRAIVSSSRT